MVPASEELKAVWMLWTKLRSVYKLCCFWPKQAFPLWVHPPTLVTRHWRRGSGSTVLSFRL